MPGKDIKGEYMANIPFSRGFNFSKWFEARTFKDWSKKEKTAL